MTQLSRTTLKCSCGELNVIIYYSSVCTWLSGNSWIKELLEGSFNTVKCKNCGKILQLNSKVMINSASGLFYINPKDFTEKTKEQLRAHGLLKEDGSIPSSAELFMNPSGTKLEGVEEIIERLTQNKVRKTKMPPAPKLSNDTAMYGKTARSLSEKLFKNKTKKDEKADISPPPPPPPPPREEEK